MFIMNPNLCLFPPWTYKNTLAAPETQPLLDFPEMTSFTFECFYILCFILCIVAVLIRFIVKFMPDKEPQPQITYAAPPPNQVVPGTVVAGGGQPAVPVAANTPAPAAG